MNINFRNVLFFGMSILFFHSSIIASGDEWKALPKNESQKSDDKGNSSDSLTEISQEGNQRVKFNQLDSDFIRESELRTKKEQKFKHDIRKFVTNELKEVPKRVVEIPEETTLNTNNSPEGKILQLETRFAEEDIRRSSLPIKIPPKKVTNVNYPDSDSEDSTEEFDYLNLNVTSKKVPKNNQGGRFISRSYYRSNESLGEKINQKSLLPRQIPKLPLREKDMIRIKLSSSSNPPMDSFPNKISVHSSSTKDYYVDESTSSPALLPPISNFKNELMTKSTDYFIVPGPAILALVNFVKKSDPTLDSEEADICNILKKFCILKTIKTTVNQNTQKSQYSIAEFTKSFIDADLLYCKYTNLLLKSRDEDFIKPFLDNGLSLTFQNELFCEAQRNSSPGFLNNRLVHLLILNGYTLELLERFYNSSAQIESVKLTIEDIKTKNTNKVTKLANKMHSFDPLQETYSHREIVEKIIKTKVSNLLVFYNKQMADKSCYYKSISERTIATQYSTMVLWPTDEQYKTITTNALLVYLKD